MRRIFVFFGLIAIVGVGAWALPADQASTTLQVAGANDAAAPQFGEPSLSATSASQAPDPVPAETKAELVSAVAAAPAVVETPATADHLLAGESKPKPEPAAVVTTTIAPPTTTAAAQTVTVAFTATQKYGTCEADVPYDVFSGKATPGSTVSITSAYGSGSTTADDKGYWQKKVFFENAPKNETFAITASGLGGSKTLSFTATYSGK